MNACYTCSCSYTVSPATPNPTSSIQQCWSCPLSSARLLHLYGSLSTPPWIALTITSRKAGRRAKSPVYDCHLRARKRAAKVTKISLHLAALCPPSVKAWVMKRGLSFWSLRLALVGPFLLRAPWRPQHHTRQSRTSDSGEPAGSLAHKEYTWQTPPLPPRGWGVTSVNVNCEADFKELSRSQMNWCDCMLSLILGEVSINLNYL